jgi:hypothetical protein
MSEFCFSYFWKIHTGGLHEREVRIIKYNNVQCTLFERLHVGYFDLSNDRYCCSPFDNFTLQCTYTDNNYIPYHLISWFGEWKKNPWRFDSRSQVYILYVFLRFVFFCFVLILSYFPIKMITYFILDVTIYWIICIAKICTDV